MTENKRFTVDYDITVGNYCLHDDCEAKGVDGYIAYLSDEERANNLCRLLNEQEERIQEVETDKFSFSYTEDYERINNNKLEVLDKHTTIQMNGDRIHIVVIPPKSKPYSFKYYISGITFEANEIKDGDVE